MTEDLEPYRRFAITLIRIDSARWMFNAAPLDQSLAHLVMNGAGVGAFATREEAIAGAKRWVDEQLA